MTNQAVASSEVNHIEQKEEFFIIGPDLRGGGKGHGLEIINDKKLIPPGEFMVNGPNGEPNQYPEKPHLVYLPKLGHMPQDLQGLAGIWIISEPLKKVFEKIDSEGFAFAACDFTLADDTPGPQYYLCNVTRTLDALDEEASKLKIEISDDLVNGKYYSLGGHYRLVFKRAVVGSAHIFRTPYADYAFCSRTLRDALASAKNENGEALTGVEIHEIFNF
jgi:hypothetical protein